MKRIIFILMVVFMVIFTHQSKWKYEYEKLKQKYLR